MRSISLLDDRTEKSVYACALNTQSLWKGPVVADYTAANNGNLFMTHDSDGNQTEPEDDVETLVDDASSEPDDGRPVTRHDQVDPNIPTTPSSGADAWTQSMGYEEQNERTIDWDGTDVEVGEAGAWIIMAEERDGVVEAMEEPRSRSMERLSMEPGGEQLNQSANNWTREELYTVRETDMEVQMVPEEMQNSL